jgi:hypothetical protein
MSNLKSSHTNHQNWCITQLHIPWENKHSDVKINCIAVELWREDTVPGIVVEELWEDTVSGIAVEELWEDTVSGIAVEELCEDTIFHAQ